MKHRISISSIRAFKKCRRQFEFSSSLRGNLTPKEPSLPFFTGSVIHTALESYYGYGMPLAKSLSLAIDIERARLREIGVHAGYDDQLQEQATFCTDLIAHYQQWINGKIHGQMAYGDHELRFLSTEEAFAVPFYTRIGTRSSYMELVGRFDGIVEHTPTGDIYLWEIKTSSRPHELIDTLENDEQAGAYIYAASEMLGRPVSGVIYNILYKKVPTQAKVLRSGKLSLDKRLSTSFEAYLEQIKANHPDYTDQEILENYGERLSELRLENKFFQRVIIRRTEQQLTNLMHHLYEAGKEMVRASTPMFPTPAFNTCKWCQFKVPCLQIDSGIDPTEYISEHFKAREGQILTGVDCGLVRVEPVGNGKAFFILGEHHTDEAVRYVEGLKMCVNALRDRKDRIDFLSAFGRSELANPVELTYIERLLEKELAA